jgi:hypothetical protein
MISGRCRLPYHCRVSTALQAEDFTMPNLVFQLEVLKQTVAERAAAGDALATSTISTMR